MEIYLKTPGMKKLLRRLAIILLFASLIPSCKQLEDCKSCKIETNNDGVITYNTGVPTCGDALKKREAEDPVTTGKITTRWVCE
jgi:hypothetical protein